MNLAPGDRLGPYELTAITGDRRSGTRASVTNASGSSAAATTTYTYNAKGQVLTATDPNNNITTYTYTAAGYLATITEPADIAAGPQALTSMTYDTLGRRLTLTDSQNRVTKYAYDARNRLVRGLDDIAVTLAHDDAISRYEAARPEWMPRVTYRR